jgi:hypothetical protein
MPMCAIIGRSILKISNKNIKLLDCAIKSNKFYEVLQEKNKMR